jgi:hypothetical protein
VRRMTDSVAREFSYQSTEQPVAVRAGYSAVQASHKISPVTLLAKARSALEALRPKR